MEEWGCLMRSRALSLLVLSAALVVVILPAPALAHQGLKTGVYECWLTQITTYSNYDLKIESGGKYVFMTHDREWKRAGNFDRDGHKLRFTSGFLKKKNFKGWQDNYIDSFDQHVHYIYLYKGSYTKDNLKYDCAD